MIYAIIAMFFAFPIIAIIYWLSSLVKFTRAKKENKINLDTYSNEEMKTLKSSLIMCSIVAAILSIIVFGTVAMFYMGIIYM